MKAASIPNRILSVFLSLALVVPATSAHGQSVPRPPEANQQNSSYNFSEFLMTRTNGMQFFKPDEFYTNRLRFDELPEVEEINAYKNEDIRGLMNFVTSEGIALGLGVNPNRDSFFNLYDPTSIDILLDEPAAEFGIPQESLIGEVGKMHYITHDSVHMYAGQIGPRLSDLKDEKSLKIAKEKMLWILLEKEAIASAFSTAHHARWYWNWRYKSRGGQEVAEFEKYNRGGVSFAKLTNNDWMELLQATLHGKIWSYFRVLQNNVDYEHYKKARELGVPMLFPSLESKLTPFGEKMLIKYGFAPLAAIANYFYPKTGYKSFKAYAELMIAYYYQPWYVRWADTFKMGLDNDSMQAHLKQMALDYRQDRFLKGVPAPHKGVFELMHIRNAAAQFGRKLIELSELDNKYPGTLSGSDKVEIKKLLDRAVQINEAALRMKAENREITYQELVAFKTSTLGLMQEANTRFPVEKTIPMQHRLAHADYSQFWFDSFAVVLERPPGLTKFLSAKGIWDTALKQRIEREVREAKNQPEPPAPTLAEARTLDKLTSYLADLYNKNRKGAPVSEVESEKTVYLNRLETFRETVKTQVYKVFIPQVKEYSHLSDEQRLKIINSADEFGKLIDERLVRFKELYTARFIEYSRDQAVKDELNMIQVNIKWAIEKSLTAMINILDDLDHKKTKNLKKGLQTIDSNIAALRSNQQVKPSVMDRAKVTMPLREGMAKLGIVGGLKFAFNQNLTKIIDKLPLNPFSRDHRAEPDLEFIDQKGAPLANQTMPKLPDNAVVILVMDHDHPALDARYINLVASKLGISRSLLLTDKEAWPHFSVHKNNDPNVLFIQDADFKEKAMNVFETHKDGKVGFMIFPEGGLPFWGTQFPLPAQFGAFSMARKAANRLAGKKPVFMVEINGNFLPSVTNSEEVVPVKLKISEPVLVPTDPVGTRDAWVETMRARFEANSNAPGERGRQYDLIDRRPDPQALIRRVDIVREYVPAADVFRKLTDEKHGGQSEAPGQCHLLFQKQTGTR